MSDDPEPWQRPPASGQATTRGVVCLERDAPGYPPLLRRIHDPPARLWVRGELGDAVFVAIVGARACSAYGRAVAESLGAALAARGVTVVSGLARGIDAAAHRGALRGGVTLAVLPNGIRRVYPATNRALAAAIVRHGALLAEFDNDEAPAPWHFPRRNRIIAGMSLCTVVVEAGEHSGARITADLALDYDREVLVVPGNITSPTSRGCNALLGEGARPCTGPDDVVDSLPADARARLRPPAPAEDPGAGETPGPAGTPARVLRHCRRLGPAAIGRLATELGEPLPALLAAISDLEAAGLVTILPGAVVAAAIDCRR